MMETKEEPATEGVAVQRVTDDKFRLFALERCIEGQELLAESIDKANPDDRYASLMVREDIAQLRDLHTDHAAIVRERDETIKALREHVAGLRKDAERYRFIRRGDVNEQRFFRHSNWQMRCEESLDHAIDAAIAGEVK